MTETEPLSVSRRRLLAGVGAGLSLAAAGCLGDESASITPVSLDGERACDQCGMIIADHPGPVGQIHFEDDEPEGGRPGQFCSSTLHVHLPVRRRGRGTNRPGGVPHRLLARRSGGVSGGSDTMFSSHVEREAFSRMIDLTVVARSEVVGAMGPELISFGEEEDVESFVEEYGGEPMAAEDVDRGTLEAL